MCTDEAPAVDTAETPAPELIEADTELVARPSDNLTISCNHEHNGTVYQVTMEKLDLGWPWGGGGGGDDSSQGCAGWWTGAWWARTTPSGAG